MTDATRIVVRPCFEQDLDQVALIYAHHVATGTGTFETAPPSPKEMKDRWVKVAARNWPWLVACPADDPMRIAGYAYAQQFRDRDAYAYAFENSVYVAPGWDRRGVGLALLGSLLTELQAIDCRQVIAVIGDSNNTASISLHARAGFQHVGTFMNIGWKFGKWLDVVLMQRELPPTESSTR